MNGQGKRVKVNGTVMEGNFQDHRLHGQGRKVLPDGTVQQGTFKNDTFIK